MPGPISNNPNARPITTPTTTGPSGPAAPAAPAQPAAAQPTAFAPQAASAGSVQNAANPSTGFTAGAASATPASAAPSQPVTLDQFKAMVPTQVDVSKYGDLAAAFKTLGKDDRHAALKYCEAQGQFGLEKYLKDSTGGGSFWSGLGNAIGESLFGGNR